MHGSAQKNVRGCSIVAVDELMLASVLINTRTNYQVHERHSYPLVDVERSSVHATRNLVHNIRPILMQSETTAVGLKKPVSDRFFFSPTGLGIATLLIVRRIEYTSTVFVFFLETLHVRVRVREWLSAPRKKDRAGGSRFETASSCCSWG